MEFAEAGYWMVVKERRESSARPLTEVRNQIQARVRAEKSITLAAEKAAAAHDDLRASRDLAKVGAKYKLSVKSTGTLTMVSKTIPDIGEDETVLNTIKRLTLDQPIPQSTLRAGSSYYVIKLKERREVSLSDFDAQRHEIRGNLEKEMQQAAWSNWVSMSMKAADIEKFNSDADIPATDEPQVE